MSRFRNVTTDVVVAVDDSKDARYGGPDWEPVDEPKKTRQPAVKKAAAFAKAEK